MFSRRMGVRAAVAVTGRSDDFNRANSATLGTPSDGGTAWVQLAVFTSNTVGIISNQAARSDATTGAPLYAVLESSLTDVTIQFTASAVVGATPSFVARAADKNNLVLCQYNGSGNMEHYHIVAGSFSSVLDSTAFTPSSGDILTLTISGNNYTMKRNGSTVFTFTDSTNTSNTKHGIAVGNAGTRVDDFSITQ
jgi:hypothetical protein